MTLYGIHPVRHAAARRPTAARLKGACLAIACLAAACLFFARPARAHEFRPAILEITATAPGRFEVLWTPAPDMDRVQLAFPPTCAREPAEGRRFVLDCGPAGLAGQPLSAAGLAPLRDEVLVRLRDGASETTAMLNAARPSFVAPAPEAPPGAQPASSTDPPAGPPAFAGRSTLATISAFAATGAAHLLTGPDHVLFVIGLLLLVLRPGAPGAAPSAPRAAASRPSLIALVRAITAFTLAHSLTLALQVLGAVRLPPAPVEAAIALSVLLLARELARTPDLAAARALAPSAEPATSPAPASLTARRPWLAAFAFGLLHGLGFAGGLSALQVPDAQILAALLGFNVGLEAAQLALVAAALLAGRALVPLAPRLPRWSPLAPAYAIGAAAAFWTLQRVAAFWA